MALEQMELADILSGVKRPVVTTSVDTPPAAPAPEPAAPAAETPLAAKPVSSTRRAHREKEQLAKDGGRLRDPDTGQFIDKEIEPEPPKGAAETESAQVIPEPAKAVAAIGPTAGQMTDKEKALLAAARDERGKRQELERRLQVLEGKQPAQPAEAPKTFWDDPERALQEFEQKIQATALKNRLDTAESIARSKYPDFYEKINVFSELLKNTAGLHAQWLASPDPADFAYRMAKNSARLEEAGGLDALIAKIEKETRLKVEQEFKQKQEEEMKKKAAIPGSLSEVSGNNPSKLVWAGPTSLDNILKP